jgi:dihydroorotate dehydrogenase (fumarate)
VAIPVAVKLTQRFTNLINVAHRLRMAGAAGLVLFAHEPRWDVALDRLHWTIHWELTPVDSVGSTVAGIVHSRASGLELSIAASGGVRTAEDAVKVMVAGADVVMITSELYRSGADCIRKLLGGLERHLETGGFASLTQFQQARPVPELRSHLMARHDYLEQLTGSLQYSDPTPVVSQQTGDRYGHPD